MRLSNEAIKMVAFGYLQTKEDERGIHFYRHTDKQTLALYEAEYFYGDWSKATTGVLLDFYTDSKNLTFNAVLGDSFEVLINGLPRYKFSFMEMYETPESCKYAIKEGENLMGVSVPLENGKRVRVTIVYPARNAPGVIEYVELDDGAELTPYTYSGKILFLGDSITQGFYASHDSLSYAYRVARFFDAEMLNQGVGGTVFNEAFLDDFDFDPDRVIIGYGTNDFSICSSMNVFKYNLDAYMEKIRLRYGDKRVYIITPVWKGTIGIQPMGTFEDCRNAIEEMGKSKGFTVIDGFKLVPHSSEYFSDAVLHPNDLGFGIYAENLIKEILIAEMK